MADMFSTRAKSWDSYRRVSMAFALVDKIKEQNLIDKHTDVMEIGCGTGLVGLEFANAAHHITMVDTSEGMLQELRKKMENKCCENISIVHGDILQVHTIASIIIVFMTLHHIEDIEQFVTEVKNRLIDGGKVIIGDLYTEDGSFHPNFKVPHNGFSEEELTSVFQRQGFKDITIEPLTTIEREDRKYKLFILTSTK